MKLCRDQPTYANGAPYVAPLIVSGSKGKTVGWEGWEEYLLLSGVPGTSGNTKYRSSAGVLMLDRSLSESA